jgi:hypothetical protein
MIHATIMATDETIIALKGIDYAYPCPGAGPEGS